MIEQDLIQKDLIQEVRALRRRVAELERADAERDRLTAILDATTDLVAVSQADGPASYVNAAGRQLLGVGARDVVRLSDFRPPAMREFVLRVAVPAALREGVWRGETEFVRADGRVVPVSQVIVARYGRHGGVDFLSTIARD